MFKIRWMDVIEIKTFSYANYCENRFKLVILNFCCPMNHDDVDLSEFPSWQRESDIIFKYFFLNLLSIIFFAEK